MPKKRKLGSKNPKYGTQEKGQEKTVVRRELMCKAKIRTGNGVDTGETADVYGVWYG